MPSPHEFERAKQRLFGPIQAGRHEADLYVNFVRRAMHGVQLTQDEWDSKGVQGSLFEILKRLEQTIAKLKYNADHGGDPATKLHADTPTT
jgi:hypothetical protein